MRRNFLFLILLCVSTAPSIAAEPTRPAPQVIQRGVTDLARALRITIGSAKERPVALILDVTPNVRAASKALESALESLDTPPVTGRWRIGALGRRLSREHRHARALALESRSVLREDTPVRNTLRALTKTLAGFRDRGGTVVYLADWHVEDDQGLESFIARLARRDQTFSVIGSEAAWNRPWTEPFYPRVRETPDQEYAIGVGRSPFESIDSEAPWHGGDTAYPAVPWHVAGIHHWRTTFPLYVDQLADESPGDADTPEDLVAREGVTPEEPAVAYAYPLASSWGPYGLMRAAAMRRGRYVLFSFNPSGRKNVTFDYGRCNALPPDLRSRSVIRCDGATRSLRSAMSKAWNLIGNKRHAVVSITAPLEEDGRTPAEMQYATPCTCCATIWETRACHDRFVRATRRDLEALEEAHDVLDRALQRARTTDGSHTRYLADATYFHHLVGVLRFQTREALTAAQRAPAGAWKNPDLIPALSERAWLIPVEGEARIAPVEVVPPYDPVEGDHIHRRTTHFLDRFGGTPPGETVALNSVHTYRVHMVSRALSGRPKEGGAGTPSESSSPAPVTPDDGAPPATPPGGAASGGRGPATGG